MSRLFAALLALGAAAAPVSAQTAPPTPPAAPASPGAYSADQATRGEKAFLDYCASCHTVEDHSGEQFRFKWYGRNVYDLWKVLKTTMPEDNVGGLSDDDYTRVVAYILKLNGMPAGVDSLKADSTEMRKFTIGPARPDTTKQRRK